MHSCGNEKEDTMKIQNIVLDESRNARLTAIIQDVEGEYGKIVNRPAIIVMPGGAYWYCSDREAEPVAFAYAKAGFHVFILRYAVGASRGWPYPLDEYEQTMELILQNQDEWHIMTDKIAVIGFSAGGHLAATAATMGKHRPNAAILGYAVLNRELTDICQKGMPYPVEEVDDETCPCFLFAARDDNMVDVSNTLQFQQALWEKGIMFESHIYAYGQHGFSTADPTINTNPICSRAANWVADSIAWLGDIFGILTPEGMTEPACAAKYSGDNEGTLSVDCTLTHLRKQTGVAETVLKDVFAQLELGIEQLYGPMSETITGLVKRFKLKDLMKMANIPQASIDELNAVLIQIPNQR